MDHTACSSAMPSWPTCSAWLTRAAHRLGKFVSSGRAEYRSNHSGGVRSVSHCGAAAASAFNAARTASTTDSSRFTSRAAVRTCVASLRCRPPALSSPAAETLSRTASSILDSTPPSTRRSRNSLSTEKSNPGSVSSSPSAYFQSIRDLIA